MAGVSLQEFHDKFGGEAQERFSKIISELTSEGYVRVDGDVVTLTTDGIALADSVYERFIS
jgi:coproporphyrinogen III oxidase-like Fe-S oxidoreductase